MTAEPAYDLEACPVRPAATLILLRDAGPAGSGAGVEVLMVRRHAESPFAPDAWVFPGGQVDDSDGGERLPGAHTAPADDVASSRAGVVARGRAFWVAAVRECFEECGILLATCTDTGAPIDPADATLAARLGRWRHRLLAGGTTLADLLAAEGLALALGQVHLVARWVTPPGPPRRFDTRFFVGAAPAGQVASIDTRETVDLAWTTPQAMFDRLRGGGIHLMRPTLAQLQSLDAFPDTAAVLSAAAGFGPPRIVTAERPRGPIDTEWLLAREERWPI